FLVSSIALAMGSGQVTGNRAGIRHAATLVGWGILTSAVSVIWPIAWIAVLGLVLWDVVSAQTLE
ncbi:hypothetical protein, partial [Citrobacter youngae]|uniref:hypothetical protein n=1 Tax=Citrobacter youngae TaxID=133448 RepID=UPI0019538E25